MATKREVVAKIPGADLKLVAKAVVGGKLSPVEQRKARKAAKLLSTIVVQAK